MAPFMKSESEIYYPSLGQAAHATPRCTSDIVQPSAMFLELMCLEPIEGLKARGLMTTESSSEAAIGEAIPSSHAGPFAQDESEPTPPNAGQRAMRTPHPEAGQVMRHLSSPATALRPSPPPADLPAMGTQAPAEWPLMLSPPMPLLQAPAPLLQRSAAFRQPINQASSYGRLSTVLESPQEDFTETLLPDTKRFSEFVQRPSTAPPLIPPVVLPGQCLPQPGLTVATGQAPSQGQDWPNTSQRTTPAAAYTLSVVPPACPRGSTTPGQRDQAFGARSLKLPVAATITADSSSESEDDSSSNSSTPVSFLSVFHNLQERRQSKLRCAKSCCC